MDCIILAGGKGTRLQPLTNDTPKPLLPVGGKPALEWNLEALPKEITTVVIAVKYLGFKIKAHFGKKFADKKIMYVNLISLRGTFDALRQCKKYLKGKTLVLYGDDIYGKDDVVRLLSDAKKNKEAWHMLVKKVSQEEPFGQVIIGNNTVKDIIEANDSRVQRGEGYINTGAYVLDERVFKYKPVKIPNGEYGLPQTLVSAKNDIPLIAIEASCWIPLNTLEDYKKANGSLF